MPFFSLLLYAFVSSFTPGPNNIMAMVFANKYGFKKTLRFCFGVGSGFFIIMLLCSYFDLLLKSFIPKMEWIMTVLGAIYMVYLAIKLIISKQHENDNNGDQNSFITGMLLQFVNPKAILYGITIVSTFILPYHTSNLSLIGYSFFWRSLVLWVRSVGVCLVPFFKGSYPSTGISFR